MGHKTLKRFFTANATLSLNNYIFSIFLKLVFICSFGSIVANIITQFPMVANVKWAFSMVLCLVGVRLIAKGILVESFKFLIFMSAFCFVLLPSWFYGGGDNTVTLLYMLMMAIEGFLMFGKPVLRWGFAVISVASCITLLTISYNFPHLIQQNEVQNVYVDTLVQVVIIFLVMTTSTAVYTSVHIKQHGLLVEANLKLEELATIDVLTNIYNRRKILSILVEELANIPKSAPHNVHIIMSDIDNFKQINDTYGHITGDIFIKNIAAHINNTVGGRGFVGRYGGDEFIVVLIGQSDDSVRAIAKELSNVPKFSDVSQSISGGISKYVSAITSDDLINQADELLLQAKLLGKNRILLWDQQSV